MPGLIAGTALVGVGSALASASMRPDGRAPFLLGAWLIAFSQVVLLALVLSPFGALTRGGWLAGHSVLAAAAAALWLRAGRPPPPGPWRPRPAAARAWARQHPGTATVIALAGVAVLFQLVVGITTAPSNWDSMTYHLSRAAYWLQEGSVGRYDGGSIRQLAAPVNAELAVAWTMATSGRDTFAPLVQWTALVAGAVAIWMIAVELGARRLGAALAAAVWCMLPVGIMESTTTQNDVVVSACVLGATAFGLRSLRTGRAQDAVLAGAAFGAGLGTKGSFLLVLPSLALVLVAAVRETRPPRTTLMRLLAFGAAGAVLLGSFSYVANLVDTGGPFGDLKSLQERRDPIPENVVRAAWSLVEAPGIEVHWANRVLDRTLGTWARDWTDSRFGFSVGHEVGEDTVAAGLVGMLVLVPLAAAMALSARSRPTARALGAGAILFVLVFGVLHAATPFNGRILLVGLALAVPLIALAAERSEMRLVIGVLAITSLLPAVLINASKPVIAGTGEAPVWSQDRARQMSVSRPAAEPFIEAVDRLPSGTRLGFVGDEDSWDYPLFGASRERNVVRARIDRVPRDPAGFCRWLAEFARAQQVSAIVVAIDDRSTGAPVPPRVTRPLEPAGGYFIVPSGNLGACA